MGVYLVWGQGSPAPALASDRRFCPSEKAAAAAPQGQYPPASPRAYVHWAAEIAVPERDPELEAALADPAIHGWVYRTDEELAAAEREASSLP